MSTVAGGKSSVGRRHDIGCEEAGAALLGFDLLVAHSPQLRRRVMAAIDELYGDSQPDSSVRYPGSTPCAIGVSR
jgi:hypothetical protein